VTNIRFEEAQAYCHWARCRLPSDEEWEKAARGTDGRTFPWGNEWQDGRYCNSKEAGMGSLTPVDHYPMGVSPYGVWDMAGNAWEWTANQVLRGGSWYYAAMFVQVIHRNWLRPTLRLGDVGFRPAL
jgi:formylglycine-generating enzyme required for sulfatase activity